jgi:hypothetical protein
MSTSDIDYSDLAADSAKHSLKRTRQLFDRSASAAFLPATIDADLLEASRARRIKTLYTQQHESQPIKSKSSNALVVSTVRDEEKGGASTVADAGRALVRKEETETKKSQSSGGGILVVRHV